MNPKTLFVTLATLFFLEASLVCPGQSPPRPFAEAHVIRSLRQLHSAQATYQATIGAGHFGSLQNLRQAGFIDEALATGTKYGYVYVVTTQTAPARFTLTATPRAYRKSGIRSFYVDQNGEIRGADRGGGAATVTDPVIDDCTNGSIGDNERCTIADMRALHSAQIAYAATVGSQNFGLFPQLYQAGLIRSDLSDYAARGYFYEVQVIDFVPNTQVASFKIWATPQVYGTSAVRSFFIDQTGVLRGADRNGLPADQNDPPINK